MSGFLQKAMPVAAGVVTLGALWKLVTSKTGKERPAKATPYTEERFRDALREAFIEQQGWAPQHGTVAMLMAHAGLESGRFREMRGNNPGNVIETREGHDYFCRNKRKWRWYPTLEAGLKDWMSLLQRRYPEAWTIALSGEGPVDYVHHLKRGGYFEEPEEPYAGSVASLYAHYLAAMEPVA